MEDGIIPCTSHGCHETKTAGAVPVRKLYRRVPCAPREEMRGQNRRDEGKGKLYQMLQLNLQPLQFSSQKKNLRIIQRNIAFARISGK